MSKLETIFEKPWNMVVGGATLGISLLVGFDRDLVDISLELRFIIVGLVCFAAMIFVVEVVALKHGRAAGFVPGNLPKISMIGKMSRITAILAVDGLALLLLLKIVTFHNIRILQQIDPRDSSIGKIEIQPSHRPTNLTLNLWTSQDGPKILRMAPASWNQDDEVEWRMQNQSASGVTLTLMDFTSPKVFGVWYRLSGPANGLEIGASADPSGVRILRDNQLHAYRLGIFMFGGGLCIVGLLYFLFRSFCSSARR
jgi:hypothetical protein